jgi:hypothetical protein
VPCAHSGGDPAVLGAVDALIADGDDEDFVDTLRRIAWRGAMSDPRSAARVAGAGPVATAGAATDDDEEEDDDEGFNIGDAEALLARVAGLGLDPAAKRALQVTH